MNSVSHNDNTKKILRIALVGIRPADQVILKGYLRLLMRLEADLEWVSANHDVVDLFMVNSEFQNAESVQRLLITHPNSAVLYITRSDNENGFLLGNELILPVKDLDPLNQWLYANLQLLAGKTAPKAIQQQNTQTANDTSAKRQSLDDVIASRQTQAVQTVAQSNIANTSIPQNSKNIALAFAKIIIRLHKKEDLLLSLNDKNGKFLAYIQPKQQRIWQLETLTQVDEWTLNVANPITLDVKKAEDLVQFFWQFGLKNIQYFESFINQNNQYRLGSFVKPDNNAQRNLVLKVQCVLEARLATLNDIAQLTQIENKTVHDIVIALILSGVMTNDVYAELTQTISQFSGHVPNAVSHDTTHTKPMSMPVNQSTTNLQHELKAEQPQSAQNTSNGGGMKGFLSRLRSKLGI